MQARSRQQGRAADFEDPVVRQEEVKKLREENRPEAISRVKIGLILEAVAEKEGLTVEEEDVSAEIERLAKDLRLSVDDVRRMVEAGGEESHEELRGRTLADKALDFVYRHAVIQG
jgi:trigger factor